MVDYDVHDRLIRRRRWWTAHYDQFAAALL